MSHTEMLTIRVSPLQKARLEMLAMQQGQSVSDVIRGWINHYDLLYALQTHREKLRTHASIRGCTENSLLGRLIGDLDFYVELSDDLKGWLRLLASKSELPKDLIESILSELFKEHKRRDAISSRKG